MGSRSSFGTSVLAVVFLAAGCAGKADDGEPVTGSVTQKGAGLESVLVIFTPERAGIPMGQRTGTGGKFKIRLPPGKYKVMLSKKVDAQGQLPGPDQDRSDLEASGALRETIPEPYSNPVATLLSAEIPEGGAELAPFAIE